MKAPRIVHACALDRGGAGSAALRLHRDLLAAGFDSRMVVATKTVSDPTVMQIPGWFHRSTWPLVPRIDYRLGRLLCPFGPKPWGSSRIPGLASRFIESLRPDIVHLHWVAHGFLSIEQIGRIPHPVVWTLHDMWPLTPGYGYRIDVGAALPSIEEYRPLMPGPPIDRLARNIWNRKLRAWDSMNSVIVGPSRWISEEARRSEVFRGRPIQTVPYSVPLNVFKPVDRRAARRALGLPEEKLLVLFGADGSNSPRKGADLLEHALKELGERADSKARFGVVLFGPASDVWLRDSPLEISRLGLIRSDEELARVYAACDVFVCPSREDNLPNTVIESLASGTPVVGFRVGGLPDLVQDEVNGLLATPFDTHELAAAIVRVLEIEENEARLGREARRLAEARYAGDKIAAEYAGIYASQMMTVRRPADSSVR